MFSRLCKSVTVAATLLAAVTILAPDAQAAWELDMPVGKTVLAGNILDLHHLILWVCAIITAGVFLFAFYTILTCRRSKGAVAAKFSHSTRAEIVWTLLPTLILIAIAIPAAREIIAIEDTSEADMSIKVTGYQWKWSYDYLDEDKFFYSSIDAASYSASQLGSKVDPATIENYLRNVDNAMVVPVNKKIRLLLTANDVIHSWWVPELYVKKDANPGFINEIWFQATEIGIYRGQCTELCGRGHGFMPIVVVVTSQKDYDRWLADELQWDANAQMLVETKEQSDQLAMLSNQEESAHE